ncbi:hypothetical protein DPMN_025362 [Dreissena polymorpha]|uniref:Uncharacterized protein n=1 Tax=Dreissena polymorpha TaxID=45954 RepID=A0A9D4RDJ9_DREPO|nr:hypothetical protein DPMN_025362 [Dreissena polymorpha]
MLKLAQTDQQTDQQTNRQGKNNMSPTTVGNNCGIMWVRGGYNVGWGLGGCEGAKWGNKYSEFENMEKLYIHYLQNPPQDRLYAESTNGHTVTIFATSVR